MNIDRYRLIDRSGTAGDYLFDTLTDARDANDGEHAIEAVIFEFSDTDLVETPDGGDVWPPAKDDDDDAKKAINVPRAVLDALNECDHSARLGRGFGPTSRTLYRAVRGWVWPPQDDDDDDGEPTDDDKHPTPPGQYRVRSVGTVEDMFFDNKDGAILAAREASEGGIDAGVDQFQETDGGWQWVTVWATV